MVYSTYKKQRILHLRSQGLKAPTITKILREEEKLQCTRVGVAMFLKRFETTGTLSRHPGSGRPSKITAEIKRIVENQMQLDDETSAVQLHRLLNDRGYSLSLRTILRCRTSLGWTFRGSAYCQLIREPNKDKRLAWATDHIQDTFDDVIFTDETTVQIETHRRFCCRKQGVAPKPKPRYAAGYIHVQGASVRTTQRGIGLQQIVSTYMHNVGVHTLCNNAYVLYQ